MINTTLDDLLVVQVNVPLLLKLDPAYEEKLVNKAIDLYLNFPNLKYGQYSRKSKVEFGTLAHKDAPDLLPVPAASAHPNLCQLLGDFDYVGNVSDAESQLSGESGPESVELDD